MSKTIIITGATSGIGKALAILLAQKNHTVIAAGRNQQALDQLQLAYPNHIKTIHADLTKHESLISIKETLPKNEQSIYLVNNAGIAIPTLFSHLSEQEFDQHYLINVKAPLFLIQSLLPHLKNGGRVLNISTGLAHYSFAGFTAYGTSKAALYLMKEFCNTELHQDDIAFGSAMPGVVDTPIQEQIRNTTFPSADIFKGFKERDELLSPKTVAKFLNWLLFDTTKEQFTRGDWDIYDDTHHQYWAESGEIKARKK